MSRRKPRAKATPEAVPEHIAQALEDWLSSGGRRRSDRAGPRLAQSPALCRGDRRHRTTPTARRLLQLPDPP